MTDPYRHGTTCHDDWAPCPPSPAKPTLAERTRWYRTVALLLMMCAQVVMQVRHIRHLDASLKAGQVQDQVKAKVEGAPYGTMWLGESAASPSTTNYLVYATDPPVTDPRTAPSLTHGTYGHRTIPADAGPAFYYDEGRGLVAFLRPGES